MKPAAIHRWVLSSVWGWPYNCHHTEDRQRPKQCEAWLREIHVTSDTG